jgi:small subunit ribosomal protein S1
MCADPTANTVGTVDNDEMDMGSFEELLDAYDFDQPKRGEILKGLILQVTNDEIILDVGTKRDAIVPRSDLERLDERTMARLEPGQEVLVYVLRPQNQDGELVVSINKALTMEDWERAVELLESEEVIEVAVIGQNKGGLLVDFGRLRGFVPNSQISDVPRGASAEKVNRIKSDMTGRTIKVKVIEVNQRRNRLVMSETAARQSVRQEVIGELTVGQIVKGEVVGIVEYGAFVDIGGGVHGLIHISKLDWQHVNHPSEVLNIGDVVEARIDQIDLERERISLNRQAVIPDPWDSVEETYKPGTLITGTVSSVAEYGIFVDLPDGITGLAHVSEMSSYNIEDPRQWAKEGDELLVRVISVDTNRRRIGLSLDAVEQDEFNDWMTSRAGSASGGQSAPVSLDAEGDVSETEDEDFSDIVDEIEEA